MKFHILLLFAIVLVAYPQLLTADDTLQKEYTMLKEKLEKCEADYWKAKYQLIESKQSLKNDMEKLNTTIQDLAKKKNNLQEDMLARQATIKNLSEKKENLETRHAELYNSQDAIVKKLISFCQQRHPFTSHNDVELLKKLAESIAHRKDDPVAIHTKLDAFIHNKITEASTCRLWHDDVLTKDNVPKKGQKFRIGSVFYAYMTDDRKDTGLLLRTSRIIKDTYTWYENLSQAHNEIEKLFSHLNTQSSMARVPMDVMQSRAVSKTIDTGGYFFSTIFKWFNAGGPVMFAILFALLYAAGIITERIIMFKNNRADVDTFMASIFTALDKGKVKDAFKACENARGPLPRLIKTVFADEKSSRNDAHNRIQEFLLHEVPFFEKHLSTLKSLGALAPLLGLLGTVAGMISLFDVITTHGTGDPKLLAGGIAEALITTEFGLIIAIIILLVHRLLLNKAEKIISDMERYSLTVLNKWWNIS